MQLTELENQIKRHVMDNFVYGDDDLLNVDTSFMANGIVDSLGVLGLVSFVEEEYGIEVADEEVVPENFDSVRNLAKYVYSKLSTPVTAAA